MLWLYFATHKKIPPRIISQTLTQTHIDKLGLSTLMYNNFQLFFSGYLNESMSVFFHLILVCVCVCVVGENCIKPPTNERQLNGVELQNGDERDPYSAPFFDIFKTLSDSHSHSTAFVSFHLALFACVCVSVCVWLPMSHDPWQEDGNALSNNCSSGTCACAFGTKQL